MDFLSLFNLSFLRRSRRVPVPFELTPKVSARPTHVQPTSINKEGVALVKYFEGFSATPYLCPADVWTIGYGTTIYPDGTYVAQGDPAISKEKAIEYLVHELIETCKAVSRLVSVPVNQNQYSALVSLTYNIGQGNFRSSTLRSKLNRGDYLGAHGEFWKWRRGGGVILPGLVKRREMSASLFNRKV